MAAGGLAQALRDRAKRLLRRFRDIRHRGVAALYDARRADGAAGRELLVAALGRTHRYFVGDNAFPSPCLDEADLRALLLGFFRQADLTVHDVDVPGCAVHGYTRIILAAGHNRL